MQWCQKKLKEIGEYFEEPVMSKNQQKKQRKQTLKTPGVRITDPDAPRNPVGRPRRTIDITRTGQVVD